MVDLNKLGAVVTKGVANVPWPGNPTPRIAEVYGGMINAIGLQNPGYDLFASRDIPFLRQYDTKIIVNVCGKTTEDYVDVVEKLDGVEVVADQDAWVQDDAVSVVSDILTANPDVNLIYAANEGGTVGATMAVKNVGKAGSVYTFGIDANEQLANMLLSDDNILQATTGQDSYTMGYNSMKDLISSIKGEETSIEEGTTEYVDGMLLERSDEDGINDYLERLSELSK